MISLIAIMTMLLDHVGVVFFPNIQIFRIIGRLSFPLFAWGIARGYIFTKNFERYAVRLILLAAVSQLPYYILFKNGNLNICFTLFIGLLVLKIYDSSLKLYIKWPILVLVIISSQYLHCEYGFYGILTIFIFYYFWDNENVIYYQFILTLISILILKYDPIELFSVFSSILILFLNVIIKKDFKLSKIFRYSFYPLHLIVLLLIKNGGFIK